MLCADDQRKISQCTNQQRARKANEKKHTHTLKSKQTRPHFTVLLCVYVVFSPFHLEFLVFRRTLGSIVAARQVQQVCSFHFSVPFVLQCSLWAILRYLSRLTSRLKFFWMFCRTQRPTANFSPMNNGDDVRWTANTFTPPAISC